MGFTYDKTQVTKREYNLYIALDGTALTGISTTTGAISAINALRIGVLAEQPKITTDKGEDVPLNIGAKVVISEIITFEAIVYEVTSANYAALRALIKESCIIYFTDDDITNGAGDIALFNGGTGISTGKQVIKVEHMSIYPALEILGNGQNKITLSAELEAGVTDANVTIYEGA